MHEFRKKKLNINSTLTMFMFDFLNLKFMSKLVRHKL